MQRPTSASVFGILNIVFAIFGVLGIFASLAVLRIVDDAHNPMVRLLRENHTYAAWFKIMIPLGLISSMVLLASGIGLLMMKNWGRLTTIGYAIYAIVFGLINAFVNFVYLVMPIFAHTEQGPPAEMAGQIGAAIGTVIGGVIGMAYPVLLLIFMTRPKLIAAFRAAQAPAIPGQSYPPTT